MATLRELKTRIGTVASSEKLTGAMKMISSAKVRKSEQELRRLLPFKDQIMQIMGHLLRAGENYSSPLTVSRDVQRLGVVVYGSDDGLCGAYNVNIFKFLHERIRAGADIFNVSAAAETPAVVRRIREQHPDVPIIATGGPTDESILETIQAGANAITWTPPSNGEIFRDIMAAYRENKPHP